MLDTHLKSPVTRRRLRSGPATQHVDAFAEWLHRQGYRPVTIDATLRSLAGWTDWMRGAGLSMHDVLAGLDACRTELAMLPRAPYRRGPNRNSLASAALFIRFLREQSLLPQLVRKPSPRDLWPLLREFHSWMRRHRGLTEASLKVYEGILVELRDALGDDPHTYTAKLLRGFVLERARRHRIARCRQILCWNCVGVISGGVTLSDHAARSSGCTIFFVASVFQPSILRMVI